MAGQGWEFQVLGPLRVARDGVELYLQSAFKTRLVLAVLLSRPDQPVSADTLSAALWGDEPPPSARRNVQQYVHQVRRLVGAELLGHRQGVYTLAAREHLDSTRFEALADAGARAVGAGDARSGCRSLRAALDCWHGTAFDGFADHPSIRDAAAYLDRRRLAVALLWAETELDLGGATEILPRLGDLVRLHPFAEDLVAVTMLALYRSGRQAEALSLYAATRTRLADELGIDPCEELRRRHADILRDDPELRPRALPGARRFLPRDIPHFLGRGAELDRLDDYSRQRPDGGTVLLSSIGGMAGVGKTALAVHWARLAADRYPDGQLYLNLRGYDGRRPLPVIDALAQLLRMVGVADDAIPSDVDAASALFRSRVVDQRMIVVLDNAGMVEQVRPLLPSGRDNFVVVTSRDRLTGLVALDGARRVDLAPLSPGESVELMRQVIGARRVDRDPAAATALCTALGCLPLAIRIAAATLQDRPGQTLDDYLRELRAAGLSSLDIADDGLASVRAVFAHSLRALPPTARRLFGLLGANPAPDLGADVAAALAGRPVADVATPLAQLCDASLLTEQDGRYHMHDLVRMYAVEVATRSPETPDALARLLDWYLRACADADRVLGSTLDRRLEPSGLTFADEWAAVSWFDTEGTALVSLVAAVEQSHPELCWNMTESLQAWMERRRSPAERLVVLRHGERAARAFGEPAAVVAARNTLVPALYYLKRYDEALDVIADVVTLRRELPDERALAASLSHHAILLAQQGHDQEALAAYQESLRLLEKFPDTLAKRGTIWNNLGWAHYLAQRYDEAIEHYQRAADIARSTENQRDIAFAEGNLGTVYTVLADHERQLRHWHNSLVAAEGTGDIRMTSNAHQNVGTAHRSLGDTDSARTHLESALRLWRDLPDPEEIAVIEGLLADLEDHCQRLGTNDSP
ncbi:BTAD domain-containing putative transcriptional regulator [Longispora sp. NPDC051575]|uniref:AfsR/SARP family transcriptional regulator n=1 Tax=Longispora sp. NPDC051575 TaxID=3154943 RepID=UPI003444124D